MYCCERPDQQHPQNKPTTNRINCRCTPIEEAADNTELVPCNRPINLVVALDTSPAVLDADFTVAKEFIQQLITAIDRRSEFGLVLYSSYASARIRMGQGLSWDQIYASLQLTRIRGTLRDTASAIRAEAAVFAEAPNAFTKMLIIITTGISADPSETAEDAKKARDAGIRVISLGIGDNNEVELLEMSGGNPENVFSVGEFTTPGLAELNRMLSLKFCEE